MYRSAWPGFTKIELLAERNDICLIAGLEVPKYSRLTEERQIGHVFTFLKFWRINRHNLVKKEETLNKKQNILPGQI